MPIVDFMGDKIRFPYDMMLEEIEDVLGGLAAAVTAVGEVGAAIGSGAFAEPVAGLTALGTGDANAVEGMMSRMTRQPTTEVGRRAMNRLGEDMRYLGEVTGLEHMSGYWRNRVVPALQQQAGPVAGSILAASGLAVLTALGEMNPGGRAASTSMRVMGNAEEGALKAFHGSPHNFDEFKMSQIGTGEGAQAYGHGLYFAESEDVATGYRDTLTDDSVSPRFVADGVEYESGSPVWKGIGTYQNDGPESADRLLQIYEDDLANNDPYIVESGGQKFVDEYSRGVELAKSGNVEVKRGSMYEVSIDANPNELLDWDLPLSEQSEMVRNQLAPWQNKVDSNIDRYQSQINEIVGQVKSEGRSATDAEKAQVNEIQSTVQAYRNQKFGSGGDIYTALAKNETNTITDSSRQAREISNQIKGITQMDGHLKRDVAVKAFPDKAAELDALYAQLDGIGESLRGSPESLSATRLKESGIKGIKYADGFSRGTGKGTSNYVIFDDRLISISKKYGITIPAAAAMLASQTGEDTSGMYQ
jgi:hypothetical protein